MSDDDLIRRGDAARAVALCSAESDSPNAHFVCRQAVNAIRAIPAADTRPVQDDAASRRRKIMGHMDDKAAADARAEALKEAAALCRIMSQGVTHYGPEPYHICEASILALIPETTDALLR